mgnify:FL=1
MLSWINESMTVLMTPLNRAIFGNLIGKQSFRSLEFIFSPLVRFCEYIGWVTYGQEITPKTSSRAKVLWQEAKRRGINMESVLLFGRDNDSYRVCIKGKYIYFSGLPRPEYMEKTAEWWMDDKALVKKRLSAFSVPVSKGGSFSHYIPLRKAFRKLEKPVIIKPRLGSRGRHTTTFIYTEEQLKKAFKIAKQLCHWVVVEEHLVGSVYRGTVIDGTLVGVLRGDPPRITGDGKHTVRQLIELKNSSRHERVSEVLFSKELEAFLQRNTMSLDDVLPHGKRIDISEKIGVSYGGFRGEESHIIHPETKRLLELGAAAIGDPILGFDFIIEDITKSPSEQKWGIIECNGVPFIDLHHDPIEGPEINVAKHIWDFVEKHPYYY